MGKPSKLSLAKKVVSQAKSELANEKQEELIKRAKTMLEEIQAAKRTVVLLERQMDNFLKEVDLE